jgi:nucleoredoxin
MNARKGKKGDFQIVWVSRCRDMNAYGQYFAQMPGWLALPPEEAMGKRGEMLSNKYKVKGIPSLVLIDDLGDTITKDARNKIPTDKAGIGFPWRNPVSNVYVTLVPKSIRLLISNKMIQRVRGLFVKAKSQQ